MGVRMATPAAFTLLWLPGCSKSVPLTTGSNGFKLKDPVWVTYGWTRNRMAYIIYFIPSPSLAFNGDGIAATTKFAKEGDTFEGGLDGYAEKSKAPFKYEAKTGTTTIEGKAYRASNGAIFLVTVGTPTKVQQVVVPFPGGPKDPEATAAFMEAEVKRVLSENPRIKEYPKEPVPEKPKKK